MSYFCLLADPANYAVTDEDLYADPEARAYWLKLFEDHFAQVLEAAKVSYGRTHHRQVLAAAGQFAATLADLHAEPMTWDGRLGVLELCKLREKALRDNGLLDPFRHIKIRENRRAVEMYPDVIRHLTSLPAEDRWAHLMRGVFAGNIFDLGSAVTMGYARENVDFEAAVAEVRPRPWLVDDFDALLEMLPLEGGDPAPWIKSVIFIDNAGADFILGVMPLARQLASHGTQVVLAANELPSLNDMTVDETVEIVQELARVDPDLASYVEGGLFEVVSTGNDVPLIDLSEVSEELNAASEDADLVILEGMGRSVESNLNTAFAVDSMQLALLKDDRIAARVGGKVFDCVCKYQPVVYEEEEAEEAAAEAESDEIDPNGEIDETDDIDADDETA